MADIQEALEYDPFAGDFGEPDDVVLKDKIAIARKAGPCHICSSEIQPKEQMRLRTEVFGGEISTFRWCNDCCVAMVECVNSDNCDSMDARYDLRNKI